MKTNNFFSRFISIILVAFMFIAMAPTGVFATNCEVSQNLIDGASGETPVHAEKTFTVDVVNVDLEINKVDADGQPLKGAKFAIYDEDGNLLEDQLVDENGQLVFKGLIPGTYSLKETVAPEGYLLPKEAIEVVVNSDGSVTFDGETLVGKMTTTDPVVSEGEAVNSPEVTVDLVPGEETVETNKVVETENAAKTVIAVRNVTATMSEVIVTAGEVSYSSVVPVATAVKYTGENKNEQILLQDLYCNNTNTDSVNVTGAPEGYPFKLIGNGDKSVHFVPKLHVTYERDEAGNALKDEYGNYIIKSISKPNGSEATSTVLTFKGEPITDVNSLYDENCGTAPTIGAFKNEDGSVLYGYCIDVEAPTNTGDWYQLANLEDNDYYATEDAENHVRNIVFNGYWGTTEGTGSLASIKAALKAALAEGKIEKEYDVTFIVKVGAYSEGYELGDGEYVYGSEVRKTVTEHVVLTDAVVDAMTEGEALDATQSAIWAYANGANFDLNGEDGVVVGNITMANSARFARVGAKNDDFEGGARAMALYNYLVSLDSDLTSTVATVINDKTFGENMSLTVGNKVSDGVYNAALSFTLGAQLTEKDDLAVVLTYVDANGEEKTIEAKLTGEGALVAENGVYTIDGLTVKVNEAFSFSLNINGDQYLEKGAYILNGEKGMDKSQSMVTIGEFTSAVDVTKSASITFEVEDTAEVSFNRYEYSVDVVNYEIEEETEVEIEEPEIPLAPGTETPQTGDSSSVIMWIAAAIVSGSLFVLTTKKLVVETEE